MWERAISKEDDVEDEGVITNNWIQGKNVRWPDTIIALRPRQNKSPPLETWHSFPRLKVKFQSMQV